MKLDQKRESDQRIEVGWFSGSPYCKNLEISMACIFFSISSGKLDIVKVLHKKGRKGLQLGGRQP